MRIYKIKIVMKKIIYLITLLFFTSCSIYNQSYMSDDLYYSMPRTYTQTNYVDLHDRYLTMKTRNLRWNSFDNDYWYWNSINLPYLMNNQYYPMYPSLWGFNNRIDYNRNNLFNNWGIINIYQSNYLNTYQRQQNTKLNNTPRQVNLQTYNLQSNTNQLFKGIQKTAPSVNYKTPTSSPVRQFNSQPSNSVQKTVSPAPSISNKNAPVRKFK